MHKSRNEFQLESYVRYTYMRAAASVCVCNKNIEILKFAFRYRNRSRLSIILILATRITIFSSRVENRRRFLQSLLSLDTFTDYRSAESLDAHSEVHPRRDFTPRVRIFLTRKILIKDINFARGVC